MALINCPECGREVSDKAQTCIHCGYPLTTASSIASKRKNDIERYVLLGDDLRTAKNYPAAMDCYLKAAELGSAHAQLWIGNFYDRGLGVEQNKTESAKWYKKAADQGNPSALCNLAVAYQNGAGVAQNIDKAILSVPERGNGGIYQQGTGLRKMVYAMVWISGVY